MSYIPAKSSSSERPPPSGSSHTSPLPGFKTTPVFRNVLRTKSIIAFELEDILCDHQRGVLAANREVASRFRAHCLEYGYARPGTTLDETTLNAVRWAAPYATLDKTPRPKAAYKHVQRMAGCFPIPTNRNCGISKQLLKRLSIIFSLTLEQETKSTGHALLLLRSLKQCGKTVIVLTELPDEHATRLLGRLSMSKYVDKLITASAFGVSKKSGLFTAALKRMKATPDDMIYVAEDIQRRKHMKYAAGLTSVWAFQKDMDVGLWDTGVEWRNGYFRATCLKALLCAAESLVVEQEPVDTQSPSNEEPVQAETASSDIELEDKKKRCFMS